MHERLVVLLLLLSGCTGPSTAPPAGSPDPGGAGGSGGADAGTAPDGGAASSELDQFVLAHMQTARIPGLAAVAVKGDHVVFSGAWGEADLSAHRPVTTDTLFMLASVSKTVTAVAAMQLWELGKFKLDDPIDAVLGYPARNPKFPNVAITYRMLLSHTSSIEDGVHSFDYYVMDMDSPISLQTLYDGYLKPGGAYYDASNWNATNAPGTHYSYSNLGLSLAGLLVEKIAGMSLQDYCQQHIFAPLGMNESSFFLKGLDRTHIAMPYSVDSSGNYAPAGYYCYPDYPDGQLRTSASQLATFLMAFIQFGQFGGAQILKKATVEEMRKTQPASEEGLQWEPEMLAGKMLLGHGGSDTGVSTMIQFDPATGAGFVVLTNGNVYSNGDPAQLAALNGIYEKMLELAEK
jgi:CubicO group peptidase (beta-lactamase class C family)